MHIDQPCEHLDLRAPINLEVNLVHLWRVLRLRLDLHRRRIIRVTVDQIADELRHRRREKQRLPLRRRRREDLLDVVAKAHVQHAVALVEDHHPQRVEFQGPALHMVHHAPRRADHHLRPGRQRAELPLVTLPTVDRHLHHAAFEKRQLVDLLGHLHRQLARRTQNQHLHLLDLRVHPLDGRNRKRRRLARSRRRLPHHVAPRQ